jgi:hypothetical protein
VSALSGQAGWRLCSVWAVKGVARGATGSVGCDRCCHWRRFAPTRVGEWERLFEGGAVLRSKEGGSAFVGRGRLDEREGESVRCGAALLRERGRTNG